MVGYGRVLWLSVPAAFNENNSADSQQRIEETLEYHPTFEHKFG
jgi:hypothetical protein